MHKLLKRQVLKYLGPSWESLSPDPEAIQGLLTAIDQAYQYADEDRALLERSIELSSTELRERNEDLQLRLQELQKTQDELARSLSLLRSTLDSTVDAIVVAGLDGSIRAHNRQFLRLWSDNQRSNMVGLPTAIFLSWLLRQARDHEQITARLRSLRSRPDSKLQSVLELKDGRYMELLSIPQLQQGNVVGRVFSLRDITKLRLDEETIRHQAYHDALTGLPNRLLMNDRLRHAIALAQRSGASLALLFLDLDHFKSVNDRLGHDVGDLLLTEVAHRMRQNLRASDTICRLGGDEFTVILEDMAGSSGWKQTVVKLIALLSQPYSIKGNEIWISASVGVSHFPNDARTAEDLLRHADMAMYDAKQMGRNRYSEFSSVLQLETERKASLEAQLRRAIERGELHLAYQPKVNAGSYQLVGFEALLRWNNPELGAVGPDEFIPVAEQCGLIVPIGYWVLATACEQLRRWRDAGFSDITMAVNLSTQQFQHPGLFDEIQRVLKSSGVQAPWLEIEITESSVMEDVKHVTGIMLALRQLGIAMSIDDFGSGYSSMSYLKNLPIDYLKIDRSFVQEIDTSNDDTAIVASIIALGHNLGLKVVAEGVETEGGLSILQGMGCDLLQGFLFSKPLSTSDAQALLEQRSPLFQHRPQLRRTGH